MSGRQADSASQGVSPLPRLMVGVVISVACLAFAARVLPEPRTIDDAFITFRYSRNLVDGMGFVYNPGARTLGTTTPLYTLLMAAVGWITGSEQYPWFALVTNAAADAVTAGLLALMLYHVTRHMGLAGVIGVLWAVNPMSVTFAIGGMETSVAILWAVAAVYLYLIGREQWMAVCAALGILTRIDSVLWVGLLFLHQVITHWRAAPPGTDRRRLRWMPWPGWGIFVAILAPWYLFSWAYFGTLLSRSLEAKRLAYHVGSLHALTRFLQHVATPFFEHETLGSAGIMIGIVLYPALAAAGTLYLWRRFPRLIPYVLFPWLYITVFSVMNPLIFRWYLAPTLPAYFLAVLLGVWALAESIAAELKRPRLLPVVVGAAGVAFVVFSLNAWVLSPDHGPDRPAPDMAWHKIELFYRDMGETLRDEYGVTVDTLVAAGDIGAVGYYSRARILDTVGLVTPEISAYYPLDQRLLVEGANYAVPPAIIFDYRPDYIVLMEDFVREGLAQDPAFNALYALVRVIPTDFYGDGMFLYQRRDLADSLLSKTGGSS